ncbi:MAG: tRNA pseudouridine(38-40) synthase TruA [Myxococcales bacterium]|nr:tRNA pseudouridine(38-40) synthase TruA [Myxococcota bacterium]MDW8283883.1 tRNA pseudouridine(38-40) synthase TruA [Myxococcales bacterium]
MRTLRLVLEYDGTGLVGWQRQPHGPSVQAALEEAFQRLTGESPRLRAAGRTDAGVHALGQVVSLQLASPLPLERLLGGLNAYLPPAIAVREVHEVPQGFDARHSASGKMYRYQVWNGRVRSPLRAATHWHVRQPLDRVAMRQAAAQLVGRHDFRAFRAADCERRTTVRWVRRLEVLDVVGEPEALHIEVEATAFLKHMVRILVGTLVEVGRGRRSVAEVAELLRSGDRTRAGPTAPAHGLILCRVDYGERTGY